MIPDAARTGGPQPAWRPVDAVRTAVHVLEPVDSVRTNERVDELHSRQVQAKAQAHEAGAAAREAGRQARAEAGRTVAGLVSFALAPGLGTLAPVLSSTAAMTGRVLTSGTHGFLAASMHLMAGMARTEEKAEARQALQTVATAVSRHDGPGFQQAVAEGDVLSYPQLARNYSAVKPVLSEPLTPYDTPAVIAERNRLLGLMANGTPDTSTITTPDRTALRTSLADRFYGSGAAVKNRQAFVIVGLPGAGKSTLAGAIRASQGALEIEGDSIREALPEFQANHSQYQVDAEKSAIMGDIKARAFDQGDNLLLSYVPSGPQELEKSLGQLKAQGYDVTLIHLDTSLDESMRRSITRLDATGRLSDPYQEKALTQAPVAAVEALRHRSDLVDSFVRVDNNGPSPVIVTTESRHPAFDAGALLKGNLQAES